MTVETEYGYELRLRYACGCVERWRVVLPPHPDDVEMRSEARCLDGCWACERDGKCEARRD